MKSTVFNTYRKRILTHALILFSISILFSLIIAVSTQDTLSFKLLSIYFLQAVSSIFMLIAPPIYFNIFWLIPKYLETKRYLNYTLLIVIIVIGWGLVLGYGEPWMDRHWFNKLDEQPSAITGFVGMFIIILISTLLHLSYRWFRQLSKIKQIENDRLHLELSLLKNQINPHFFFNTLNNLYALSLEKSDKTPSVILKLSDMMRYTIYDCKAQTVTIVNEVTYLENFMALQKLRHHKRGVITFKKEINDVSIQIAPMILIIFIENAFKHGFDHLEKNAFINFRLISTEKIVHLYIENNFNDSENGNQIGIGLENVKRRLSLIYPDAHELKIVKNEHIFSVDLKLYLK